MVACIVQIATCTRALRVAKETVSPHLSCDHPNLRHITDLRTQRSGTHYNFYNYAHSILILMLWVLPINIPVLVVWVHNLAVHWLTPFSSHHNVLSIMPFILLVETLTGGGMIPRVTSRYASTCPLSPTAYQPSQIVARIRANSGEGWRGSRYENPY